jgi:hypothetical protein
MTTNKQLHNNFLASFKFSYHATVSFYVGFVSNCIVLLHMLLLNDLNYIVNTPMTRRKKQICHLTTQGFSEEYKLTVDTSDVSVDAVLLQEG